MNSGLDWSTIYALVIAVAFLLLAVFLAGSWVYDRLFDDVYEDAQPFEGVFVVRIVAGAHGVIKSPFLFRSSLGEIELREGALIEANGFYLPALALRQAAHWLGLTQREVDRVYREALCALGAPFWHVAILYGAVRMRSIAKALIAKVRK